jgi:hypothetical protein
LDVPKLPDETAAYYREIVQMEEGKIEASLYREPYMESPK